ncbi:aluminum-activated malate transporter 8-like isoform X2 [Vigna radiata var. radiata]|uniref:Aluminum-activated malate transporter 8-like isoform X2 n=1 Tax=Vigna radiata var. radiata TaxID=3916 RepID=A0A1S3TMM6_VIGRR|nr:aluminum-activated malate transporter 8-like isoform X2 [Vigna radiata var. radiata]
MDIESTMEANKEEFFVYWKNCLKALSRNIKFMVINFIKSITKIGKDDPRRVFHSLKVAFALTLVSLFYYSRPLYDGFGDAGMWAVLTVVVVFEFSVGATLYKSLNRGCATLLAGALGVGGQHLASACGEREKPIVLGILVFILAAGATFFRFFPKIKARYDYGLVIFILTFCLVAVSGYRVEELFELAHQRLSTILIGVTACMVISIFICPVWAGEDLHKLVASNIEKLSNYLQGFEVEYFHCSEDKEKCEKSILEGYKTVLNSKASEESLANLARWEPGHGGFRLRHPWTQYLKIGVLTRECAYKIETLNNYLNPKIPTSLEFKCKIQEPCTKMISESNKALNVIFSSIKTMTHPSAAKSHIENAKTAVEELKFTLETVSLEGAELLSIIPVVTVVSILKEITKSVEKIYESVSELSHLAYFKSVAEPNVSPEKSHLLHRGIIKPVVDIENTIDHVTITIPEITTDSPEKEKTATKPCERM